MNEIMDVVNQQIVHIKELEARLAEAEQFLNKAEKALEFYCDDEDGGLIAKEYFKGKR